MSGFASSQSRNFRTVNNISNDFPNLAQVSSDIVPSRDNFYVIGTNRNRWRTVYANQINAVGDNAGLSSLQQVSVITDLNVGGTTTTENLDVNGTATFQQMSIGDFTPDARLIDSFQVDPSTNLQVDNSQALSATSINATQYITSPWLSAMGVAITDKLQVTSAFNTTSATDQNSAFNIRDGGGNVGQDWRVGGNFYVVGSSQLSGAFNTSGIVSISNTTDSASASDTTSSLNSAGGGNVQKNWRVGGNFFVVGTSSFTGNVTAGTATITTANITTLNIGTFSAIGNLSVSNNLTVGGTSTSTGPIIANSSNTASGAGTPAVSIPTGGLRVGTSQGIQSARNLLTGDTELVGDLYQTDGVGILRSSLVSGALTVQSATVNGNVAHSGTLRVNNSTVSSSTTTGAAVVTGGVGVGGALNVGGASSLAGVVSVTNSTASSSTTTGGLVVTGGVGIGGNLNVGGSINNTNNSNSIGGTQASALRLTSNNPGGSFLPAATNFNLHITGDGTSACIGRVYIGDNTGWRLKFPVRTGSADSDRFDFLDNGQLLTYVNRSSTSTTTGTIVCAGGMGVAGDTNSAGYWKTSNSNTAQNSNPAIHINSTGGIRQGTLLGLNSCTNVFQNSTDFLENVFCSGLFTLNKMVSDHIETILISDTAQNLTLSHIEPNCFLRRSGLTGNTTDTLPSSSTIRATYSRGFRFIVHNNNSFDYTIQLGTSSGNTMRVSGISALQTSYTIAANVFVQIVYTNNNIFLVFPP